MTNPFVNKRALLLSYDDTSIYHAKIIEKQFTALNIECDHALVTKRNEVHVNQRQIDLHKIEYKYKIPRHRLAEPWVYNHYDIYFSAVPIVPLRGFERFYNRSHRKRPIIIYSFRGIEEPVHVGFMNRLGADLIILNNKAHLKALEHFEPLKNIIKNQVISIGNPIFWQHVPKPIINNPPQDIYFYTQSIIPKTKIERLRVAQNLLRYALKYPNRNIWIKLRHLPDENQNHSHIEEYDFPTLFAELCPNGLPDNLKYTAEDMRNSMEIADFCLTVRSTAIFETLFHHIPSALLPESIDFLPQTFKNSGLILDYATFLNGDIPTPNMQWMSNNIPQMGDAVNSFTSQLAILLTQREQSAQFPLANKQLIRRGLPYEKIHYKQLKKSIKNFIKQQDKRK